jgi:biopolymer transport protein ExbD
LISGARRRRGLRSFGEINLIPLIDVSLILVVIFMLLTPILVRSELAVKLPKAHSAAPVSDHGTIVVQIDRNGHFILDGAAVRADRLEPELVLRLGRAAQKSLLVQADRAVAVEKVVQVLDLGKRLGVGKLGVGVKGG